MTKKQFLRGYIEAGRRVALKENQMQRLHGDALDRLKDDIRNETVELQKRRAEIIAAIETAPTEREKAVMEALYINGLPRAAAANAVGYSRSQLYRIREEALKHMRFPEGVA